MVQIFRGAILATWSDYLKSVHKKWNITLIYYSWGLWPCVGGTLSRNLNTDIGTAWESLLYSQKFSRDPIFAEGPSSKICDLIFTDGSSRIAPLTIIEWPCLWNWLMIDRVSVSQLASKLAKASRRDGTYDRGYDLWLRVVVCTWKFGVLLLIGKKLPCT